MTPAPGCFQTMQVAIANHQIVQFDETRRECAAYLAELFEAIRSTLQTKAADYSKDEGKVRKMGELIADNGPNVDPFGDMSDAPTSFDSHGSETFRHFQSLATASQIRSRFMAEEKCRKDVGDIIDNEVLLPSGQSVSGTQLIRGETALQIDRQKAEKSSKSRPPYGFPSQTDNRFMVRTAKDDKDRNSIHAAAFESLTECFNSKLSENEKQSAFIDGIYFLYQGLQYNRGGDANIRTFGGVVAFKAFQRPIALPQDIDLQAYVRTQGDFRTTIQKSFL